MHLLIGGCVQRPRAQPFTPEFLVRTGFCRHCSFKGHVQTHVQSHTQTHRAPHSSSRWRQRAVCRGTALHPAIWNLSTAGNSREPRRHLARAPQPPHPTPLQRDPYKIALTRVCAGRVWMSQLGPLRSLIKE